MCTTTHHSPPLALLSSRLIKEERKKEDGKDEVRAVAHSPACTQPTCPPPAQINLRMAGTGLAFMLLYQGLFTWPRREALVLQPLAAATGGGSQLGVRHVVGWHLAFGGGWVPWGCWLRAHAQNGVSVPSPLSDSVVAHGRCHEARPWAMEGLGSMTNHCAGCHSLLDPVCACVCVWWAKARL